MKLRDLHYVVWKEGKWFVARSLEVEVASQGRTEKAAVKNLREAVELYMEDEPNLDVVRISQPKLQRFSLAG